MKRFHYSTFAGVALLLTLFVALCRGEDNDQTNTHLRDLLVFLEQHGYGLINVEADHNREIVRSKVNDEDVYFLLDSGFSRTYLFQDCAKDLKLDIHHTNATVNGVGGTLHGVGEALTHSFTLNGHEINRINPIGVLPPRIRSNMAQGILGEDCLHLNAVIMPVGASLLLFKPGTTVAPALDSYMAQLGYQPVPLTRSNGGLYANAELNDQQVHVLIDSGAMFSFFDIDLVRKTNKSTIWKSRVSLSGIDGNRSLDYAFTPSQLSIGPIQLEPQTLCAGNAPLFKSFGLEALVGFDLLFEHHAIIDFGHDVLWMKP